MDNEEYLDSTEIGNLFGIRRADPETPTGQGLLGPESIPYKLPEPVEEPGFIQRHIDAIKTGTKAISPDTITGALIEFGTVKAHEHLLGLRPDIINPGDTDIPITGSMTEDKFQIVRDLHLEHEKNYEEFGEVLSRLDSTTVTSFLTAAVIASFDLGSLGILKGLSLAQKYNFIKKMYATAKMGRQARNFSNIRKAVESANKIKRSIPNVLRNQTLNKMALLGAANAVDVGIALGIRQKSHQIQQPILTYAAFAAVSPALFSGVAYGLGLGLKGVKGIFKKGSKQKDQFADWGYGEPAKQPPPPAQQKLLKGANKRITGRSYQDGIRMTELQKKLKGKVRIFELPGGLSGQERITFGLNVKRFKEQAQAEFNEFLEGLPNIDYSKPGAKKYLEKKIKDVIEKQYKNDPIKLRLLLGMQEYVDMNKFYDDMATFVDYASQRKIAQVLDLRANKGQKLLTEAPNSKAMNKEYSQLGATFRKVIKHEEAKKLFDKYDKLKNKMVYHTIAKNWDLPIAVNQRNIEYFLKASNKLMEYVDPKDFYVPADLLKNLLSMQKSKLIKMFKLVQDIELTKSSKEAVKAAQKLGIESDIKERNLFQRAKLVRDTGKLNLKGVSEEDILNMTGKERLHVKGLLEDYFENNVFDPLTDTFLARMLRATRNMPSTQEVADRQVMRAIKGVLADAKDEMAEDVAFDKVVLGYIDEEGLTSGEFFTFYPHFRSRADLEDWFKRNPGKTDPFDISDDDIVNAMTKLSAKHAESYKSPEARKFDSAVKGLAKQGGETAEEYYLVFPHLRSVKDTEAWFKRFPRRKSPFDLNDKEMVEGLSRLNKHYADEEAAIKAIKEAETAKELDDTVKGLIDEQGIPDENFFIMYPHLKSKAELEAWFKKNPKKTDPFDLPDKEAIENMTALSAKLKKEQNMAASKKRQHTKLINSLKSLLVEREEGMLNIKPDDNFERNIMDMIVENDLTPEELHTMYPHLRSKEELAEWFKNNPGKTSPFDLDDKEMVRNLTQLSAKYVEPEINPVDEKRLMKPKPTTVDEDFVDTVATIRDNDPTKPDADVINKSIKGGIDCATGKPKLEGDSG